jgi:hypothetical protein
MANKFEPRFMNKHGHKSYFRDDVAAGAVCDCAHCSKKAAPKKAVAKKEEKKE